MRTIRFVFFISFCLLFTNYRSYAQLLTLREVKVDFVSFDIETFADVGCAEFENMFKEEKQTRLFSDKATVMRLEWLIRQSKPVSEKKSIDVRGAITCNYGKTSAKYCFDRFGCFYHDGRFYFNKDLLIYITDKLYSEHDKYMDTLKQ